MPNYSGIVFAWTRSYTKIFNVIDSTQDNFIQTLCVQEILDELEISKVDYYRALPISKDEDLELDLKRQPNSCFFNHYFDVGLEAWHSNMNTQPVFNEYKAVTYMCQFFSKTEDQCSQAMKMQPRTPLRTTHIILTQWRESLGLT